MEIVQSPLYGVTMSALDEIDVDSRFSKLRRFQVSMKKQRWPSQIRGSINITAGIAAAAIFNRGSPS
jgi:hypothetical protein